MKIVLVAQRAELKNHISDHFLPQGSEIIQYWNPIKAMDNIDEIEPDLVLFSAVDFPRHWKPFLVYLRSSRDRDSTVFVILKGDNFAFEEASKAHHLGANGIVHEDLENKREIARLKELVSRYKEALEARRERRYIPGPSDRVAFLFAHPDTLRMITGTVADISAGGIRVGPDVHEYVSDLMPGTVLPACSLRAGDTLLSIDAMVVRNDTDLQLFFRDIQPDTRTRLSRYLSEHISREIQAASRS
jgi:DNA-binding response OmpR family regulator